MEILLKIYSFFFGDTDLYTLLIRIIIGICIIITFKIISLILSKNSKNIAKKLLRNNASHIHSAVAESIDKPLKLFLFVTGIYVALIYIPFSVTVAAFIKMFFTKIYRIFIVYSIAWSTKNFIDRIPNFSKAFNNSKNKTLLLFFIKFGDILIIFLTLVIIFKEFNYDINGIIAGLGLGGLTVALAAQDTASNLFSGMVILFDKPFAIGDWISVANMEGIVEEMNFRSCRIRTFDNALISVPNSKISSDSVTNWARMDKRKARITFGVTYSTPKETIQKICLEIRENLKNYPEIVQDTVLVWFDNFNSSSLDIIVQYHSLKTSFEEYHKLKEQILYMIMTTVENNNSDFAFDTKTVILQKQ